MLGTLPHPPSYSREGGKWTESNGAWQASDLPGWNWHRELGNSVEAQTSFNIGGAHILCYTMSIKQQGWSP